MPSAKTPPSVWPHSLMWFRSSAKEYMEGLPIGNGMLAAMVLGGAQRERVGLNHEWLWRGNGRGRDTHEANQHLREIREMFFAGKVMEAGTRANERLGGLGGLSGQKPRVDPYQPAGDLLIETDHTKVASYRRQLDLDSAVAAVTYKHRGAAFTRECFAHSSLPVIAIRLAGSAKAPLKASLVLGRIEDSSCQIVPHVQGPTFGFTGRFPEGIRFTVAARVVTDGRLSTLADAASRRAVAELEAAEAIVLLSIAVSLDDQDPAGACTAQIDSASLVGQASGLSALWPDLLSSHLEAHQAMYRRVKIDIGQDRPGVPTDRRVKALAAGKADEGIFSLYANLGRYLLISSSRPGGLPPNLQGKWNEELNPPWECDLHQDVNLQMNYWAAETAALGDLTAPLFDHCERFVPHARLAAKRLYGCGGILLMIQTDPWGRATPEARGWDVWTGAAAWLAQHYWFRYEYGLDRDFLRQRAYPFFKEVAAFYQDYLVRDPRTNKLVPVPSQSPENTFVGGTWPVSLCVAATMDLELIRDVLGHAIAAAEILGVDQDLRDKWRAILADLPPLQIGKHGQLQEWLEDYDEGEPGHRHISHLFALYPSDQITLEDEPRFAAASRTSLQRRLAAKGGHTGWSRAWTVCCWARLRQGREARHHLERLIADFATVSLLDLHPPRIFQIDGNFGGTAGMLEMLIQSHRGMLRLLPALPEAWASGSVQGLRARGGFIVNMAWSAMRPTEVAIESLLGQPCRLGCPDADKAEVFCDGKPVPLGRPAQGVIQFDTQSRKTYRLRW